MQREARDSYASGWRVFMHILQKGPLKWLGAFEEERHHGKETRVFVHPGTCT